MAKIKINLNVEINANNTHCEDCNFLVLGKENFCTLFNKKIKTDEIDTHDNLLPMWRGWYRCDECLQAEAKDKKTM